MIKFIFPSFPFFSGQLSFTLPSHLIAFLPPTLQICYSVLFLFLLFISRSILSVLYLLFWKHFFAYADFKIFPCSVLQIYCNVPVWGFLCVILTGLGNLMNLYLESVVSTGKFLVIMFTNTGHTLFSRTPSTPIVSVHFPLIQLEYFLLNYLPDQAT